MISDMTASGDQNQTYGEYVRVEILIILNGH
jgi:hypothetical protein